MTFIRAYPYIFRRIKLLSLHFVDILIEDLRVVLAKGSVKLRPKCIVLIIVIISIQACGLQSEVNVLKGF